MRRFSLAWNRRVAPCQASRYIAAPDTATRGRPKTAAPDIAPPLLKPELSLRRQKSRSKLEQGRLIARVRGFPNSKRAG